MSGGPDWQLTVTRDDVRQAVAVLNRRVIADDTTVALDDVLNAHALVSIRQEGRTMTLALGQRHPGAGLLARPEALGRVRAAALAALTGRLGEQPGLRFHLDERGRTCLSATDTGRSWTTRVAAHVIALGIALSRLPADRAPRRVESFGQALARRRA